MQIIESWEDHLTNAYAIVRHSEEEREKYKTKEYEGMYMLDGQLESFGGSVGFGTADFDMLEQAQDFLLKGIAGEDSNPDIWLEMVEVK